MAIDRQAVFDQAAEILRANDLGAYTVPTKGLYPFQWNWDSCLTALGLAHIDEARAWTEIETLMAHQWPDGMVPHIVFHAEDDGYFPGPDVWRTGRPVPTSGITQPAVAGFVVKRLFDRAGDRELAAERAGALIARIDAWHRWFFECRDPNGDGLVAIIHPWESGRDNSCDWDLPLARVPIDGVLPYRRRDLEHADALHRPTNEQYDRYLWLVQRFRRLRWDNRALHDASPFRMVDPGFNAILIRSCADLATLARALGDEAIAADNAARAEKGLDAIEGLWCDRTGQYACYDRASGTPVGGASVGGLLPVFAGVGEVRGKAIARRIDALGRQARFLVPSHDPADPGFDPKRYWRGPAWLVVNYMIADGLVTAGETASAERIIASSLELVARNGFAEYYDPRTGEPLGGSRFSWTAAIALEFLRGE